MQVKASNNLANKINQKKRKLYKKYKKKLIAYKNITFYL